jgi:1L-myo-inositol 1-phosphate cytidylyltransferase
MGSRLNPEEGHKLLARVGGRPMLDWHIDRLSRLGVTRLVIVTGFESDSLERQLQRWELPPGMVLDTTYNPEWRGNNGLSVLAGARVIDGPFWLTMSDHLLSVDLIEHVQGWAESFEQDAAAMLAVDSAVDQIFDVPDANKLRFEDGRLDAIGKDIAPFDVADTGLFWCGDGFVEALKVERDATGDCTTSDGLRRLDSSGQVAYVDVVGRKWQDVDTPGAQKHAEKLIAAGDMG